MIEDRDKTIYRQTEELRKYTHFKLDQQLPSSSLKEEVDESILFNTDLSFNEDNEPFPILDDDTIRVRASTGTGKETNKHATTSHSTLIDTKAKTFKELNTTISPIALSAGPSALTIKNTSSHKSEKSIKPSNVTPTTPTTSSSSSASPNNTHKKNIQAPANNNNDSNIAYQHSKKEPHWIQSKLTDVTNTQSTTTTPKKRKIPSSLTASQPLIKQTKSIINNENKGYAYSEPCRNKHDRSKMMGNTCTCCKSYFHDEQPLKQYDTNEVTAQDRIQLHSRHRTRYEPPKTPPGFWELDFPPSYDD
ncbi:hypothetical protein K501DRAFT_267292 [Backusella circina FSU 941]|nr:hypothetical protein K501DRAFT_267292 [Backusella circina FSU 941]